MRTLVLRVLPNRLAVRMVAVALGYLGTGVRPQTLAFVGWFGPRGLASIVFALNLVEDSGLRETNAIVTTVAVTVGLSVLLHGLTGVPGAKAYGAWFTSHPRRHELREHA